MQIPALTGVMRSSGAEYLGISKSGQIAIMKVKDASGHEHAANGQFGSGGSSAAKPKPKGKESQGAKHKRNQQARRAEGAGQSTLGGGKAIQTLLGGGSALDKIGWLNTSKPKGQEAAKEPDGPDRHELTTAEAERDVIYAEHQKLEAGIEAILHQRMKLNNNEFKLDAALRDIGDKAKQKLKNKAQALYDANNKVWGIKHRNDPVRPESEMNYGETEVQTPAPSKPRYLNTPGKRREQLYDEPGATNSWNEYH